MLTATRQKSKLAAGSKHLGSTEARAQTHPTDQNHGPSQQQLAYSSGRACDRGSLQPEPRKKRNKGQARDMNKTKTP
ncbi:hypothetical protein U1Q18_022227 [Sarracenia purpurea var. burkii]